MKKIISASSVLLASITANAQGNFESFRDREFNFDVLHISATLIGIFLFTSFFLSIIRMVLDNKIKNRMIEKGVAESVVEQFLQPSNRDSKSAAIKWFLILACIGAGLTLVNMTMPFGIHSIAILAISTSLGFLGYYFFIKKSERK